jgi:hypothetical protein
MGEKKGALLFPAAERRREGESAMGDCELGPEKAHAMAGAEGRDAGLSALCTQGKQQGKRSSAREGAWRGSRLKQGWRWGRKGGRHGCWPILPAAGVREKGCWKMAGGG